MVYWKLDDETIRCLINKEEIKKMGFDLGSLTHDQTLMSEFLDAIVNDSHKYIDWNTENGVQNFVARALPADQYLITISCTFKDEAINQDLEQIKRMFSALNSKISIDRIEEVSKLSGEEKENAFAALSKDLHDVCMGQIDDNTDKDAGRSISTADHVANVNMDDKDGQLAADQKKTVLADQKLTFDSMSSLMDFCSILDRAYSFRSKLYRNRDKYVLLLDFDESTSSEDIMEFILNAEEFGAVCEPQALSKYYLQEHADLLIDDNAVNTLIILSK